MSRKQFIKSQGATCKNWYWSWSFVNEAEKFVIFGIWDKYDEGGKAKILSKGWAITHKGKRSPGYRQSREHIRLIEEEDYQLKTFPMEYATADESDQEAPAKIKAFTPVLSDKRLIRIENCWFALN